MAATDLANKADDSQAKSPVLEVTQYDRVSSSMIATVMGLILAVICLVVIWFTNRPPAPRQTAPLEFVELAGGVEDGAIDESFDLESPEEETLDPSLAETVSEETQVQEMLETVVELSDSATSQVQDVYDVAPQNTGKAGSSKGTGRRPLGMGPGKGGFPREQRWFIRFADGGTLDEYVDQLTFFGIQLSALFSDGRLVYLSKLKSNRPKTKTVKSGTGENRMYMTWRGGNRRQGDMKLFQKAGIDVSGAVILHFYPPETEAMLAQIEFEYRKRPSEEIRRTYFSVVRDRSAFKFVVSKQSYLH